ncbi:MutS-related protein [Bacteroides sp.]
MEQLDNIIQTYKDIIKETEQKLSKEKQRIYRISTLRLILFVAGIVGVIHFWDSGWLIVAGVAAITFLPFIFLVKLHNRLFYEKEYLEKKIEINRQELQAIDYDISSFDGGKEFINPAHLYTYDLDVFGEHSLFQYINRTSTDLGKKRLANWLDAHLENKEAIEKRQEGVKELAPELRMRQHFRILGLLYKGKSADEDEIMTWAASPSYYRNHIMFRALPIIVPTINIVLIALAIAGVISGTVPSAIFVGFFLLSLAFSRGITKIQTLYGKKLQILATYASLIHIIEEKELHSTALQEIQKLVGGEKQTASQAVKKLTALMNALDQRNNMLMSFVLNGSLFWELRQIMRIEAWKESHAAELSSWLKAIGEMDAYCSLATFSYNHPGYIYPEISSQPFSMQAEALGHPLMNRDKCVRNDINIAKRPFFIIITGANMAGKSTYLRTVGINYLLACIGVPVWANQMKLYPARLVTSLRTSDSLTDNESYFFAELKRLKLIIDKLDAGEELFIILDEILKGTNSTDKQKGSFALIKQFMALKTNGIIATHDLMLGTLINLFPEDIRNYCFEAEITNNELTFSYQMKKGVAQNMNACFLMKKMGIAVIDD